MLEKILLYNVKNPQHIIKAASNMRIISGFINESDTDRTLATGEHNAVIKISTASLTDGKTMNGANVETVLVAK